MRLFEGTPFDRPPRCERCDALLAECQCPPVPAPRTAPGKQRLRLQVEKRKRGKLMTVIRGLADEPDALKELLSELKNSCGAGGTIEDGLIEIQGDQLEKLRSALTQRGYKVQ